MVGLAAKPWRPSTGVEFGPGDIAANGLMRVIFDPVANEFISSGLVPAFKGLSSLGASSYQRLPSGLIIQCGIVTSTSAADLVVAFPVTFPSVVPVITANAAASPSATEAFVVVIDQQGPGSFVIRRRYITPGAVGTATPAVFWQAIGY